MSDGNEYFVSTAQKGRAHQVCQWCVLWQPVLDKRGRESPRVHVPILKVKSHASEWSLWSGQGISQSGCSWRPEGLKRTNTPSGLSRKSQESGVWPGRCRGGPLSPWTWPSSTWTSPSGCLTSRSLASTLDWRSASNCLRMCLSLGAGQAPSNAPSACRSASTSTRVSGCPRRAHGGKRKIHPFIPLPPGSPDPGPPPPSSEMG